MSHRTTVLIFLFITAILLVALALDCNWFAWIWTAAAGLLFGASDVIKWLHAHF